MTLSDAEQGRRVTRYEVMKRALIIFTSVVVTIVLVGVSIGVHVLIELARTNHEALSTIRDCTQTSGECHKRGLREQAKAVAALNVGTQQTAAAATACATSLARGGKPVTFHSVYRCIVAKTRDPQH